jgi:hypothetical protein
MRGIVKIFPSHFSKISESFSATPRLIYMEERRPPAKPAPPVGAFQRISMLFPGSERREKPAVVRDVPVNCSHQTPKPHPLYLHRPSYPLGCASSSLLTRGIKRLYCLIGSFWILKHRKKCLRGPTVKQEWANLSLDRAGLSRWAVSHERLRNACT